MPWTLLAILTVLFPRAYAAPPLLRPVSLGVVQLSNRAMSYRVRIPSCAAFGRRLVSVRLQQLSGQATYEHVEVHYADRRTRRVPLLRTFRPGEGSAWLDLAVRGYRDNRCAAKLFFTAQAFTGPVREPVRVAILGVLEASTLGGAHR